MSPLRAVKLIHTIIWAGLAACILAIPILTGLAHLRWAAVAAGIVAIEVLVLLANGMTCPLTKVAAQHTSDRRANFDIYLPEWLARHNKAIFGPLYVVSTFFLVAMMLLSGCKARPEPTGAPAVARPAAVPRGDRLLGLQVNEGVNVTFVEGMTVARQTGFQVMSMSVAWDDLEASPGHYAPDPNWLAIANAYYPSATPDLLIDLVITPIDTNRLRTPSDLKDRAFDDPEVLKRFELLLEYVLKQIPKLKLRSIAIGNEVDHYLRDDVEQWRAYGRFLAAAKSVIANAQPGVLVGVKTTFDGLSRPERRTQILALNQATDEVLVTYYPLAPSGMKPPAEIRADLASVVATFKGRTVAFSEIGCPSGEGVGSSQDKQARCVRAAFDAWDEHRDSIRLLHFTWLHDADGAQVGKYAAYYEFDTPEFRSFVGSLGLRTAEGQQKAGFRALVEEAKARGW